MRRIASLLLCCAIVHGCNGNPMEPVGPPASLQIVSGDGQVGTVGMELPAALVLRIVDSSENPVTGQIVNFQVTAGGGSVFAGAAITNDSGIARERWTLGTTAGAPQEVEARAVDANSGAALLFGVFEATASAGPPNRIEKSSSNPSGGMVGQPVNNPPAVRVFDQYDNAAPMVSVTFAVTAGGGSVTGGNATTDASGIATVGGWTLGPVAGLNTLSATVGQLPAVTFDVRTYEVLAVSAGDSYGCALVNEGTPFCWGRLPVPASQGLVTGATFESIATGNAICGLTSDGIGYCWGNNQTGAVGDGSFTGRVSPVPVVGGLTFSSLSIAISSTTCGLTTLNEAYCWGNNQMGQVGDNTVVNRNTPTLVTGGLTFTTLRAGGTDACGLVASGAAYCWGSNAFGRLGDGTTIERHIPTAVAGGLVYTNIYPGGPHACGLASGGFAYCWGFNQFGQVGDNTTTNRSTPTAVVGGLTFTSLAVGAYHTCGLTSNGTAYCWGDNTHGQVGDGTTDNVRSAPTPVAGGLSFVSVSGGFYHTCGLATNGVAYCWGSNDGGGIGDGNPALKRPSPSAVVFP